MKLILISVNKQNCRICDTENSHVYIEKRTHPKQITVWHGFWAIFLRKWARRGRYSQWRSLSSYVKRIFVHKNWRERYWQHLVSTGRRYVSHSRNYTRCFALCFLKSYHQPQSWCRLATSELWLNGESIGEIQVHTIDNVLKNWTDRFGYWMTSKGSQLNEIIFHYYPEGLYFQMKKEIWENIQVLFSSL